MIYKKSAHADAITYCGLHYYTRIIRNAFNWNQMSVSVVFARTTRKKCDKNGRHHRRRRQSDISVHANWNQTMITMQVRKKVKVHVYCHTASGNQRAIRRQCFPSFRRHIFMNSTLEGILIILQRVVPQIHKHTKVCLKAKQTHTHRFAIASSFDHSAVQLIIPVIVVAYIHMHIYRRLGSRVKKINKMCIRGPKCYLSFSFCSVVYAHRFVLSAQCVCGVYGGTSTLQRARHRHVLCQGNISQICCWMCRTGRLEGCS